MSASSANPASSRTIHRQKGVYTKITDTLSSRSNSPGNRQARASGGCFRAAILSALNIGGRLAGFLAGAARATSAGGVFAAEILARPKMAGAGVTGRVLARVGGATGAVGNGLAARFAVIGGETLAVAFAVDVLVTAGFGDWR
jgi:hypothetical protein